MSSLSSTDLALVLAGFAIVLLLLLAAALGMRNQTERTRSYYKQGSYRFRRWPWDGSRVQAQYQGRCPRCGRAIKLGDDITWWSANGDETRWVHVKCLT